MTEDSLKQLPKGLKSWFGLVNPVLFAVDYKAFAHVPRSLEYLRFIGTWKLELFLYLPTFLSHIASIYIEGIGRKVAEKMPLRWLHYLLNRNLGFGFDHYNILDLCWPSSSQKTPIHETTSELWKTTPPPRGNMEPTRRGDKDHWAYP